MGRLWPETVTRFFPTFYVNEEMVPEDHLKRRLFDLYTDPVERVNLVNHPDYQDQLDYMKRRLLQFMIRSDDPLLKGDIPMPKGSKTDHLYQIGPDYKPLVLLIIVVYSNYVIGNEKMTGEYRVSKV